MANTTPHRTRVDFRRLIAPIEEQVRKYGSTPKGLWADKNSSENLVKRYDALFEIMEHNRSQKLLDLGCGTGLALDYIEAKGWLENVDYMGIDISSMMIEIAQKHWPQYQFQQRDIMVDKLPDLHFDCTIIAGVFTSKFNLSYSEMELFVHNVLRAAWPATRHALAFNAMTIHVDWQRPELFHWPLDSAIGFCKRHLSRHVIVRADYGLYEYTVQVYRDPRPSSSIPSRWL